MAADHRALLGGLVDYAGLFPPASLSMAETVRNYAEYWRGPHAWILGRLVVPAARLPEFETEFERLSGDERANRLGPWRLSALVGGDVDADLEIVKRLSSGLRGRVVVDSFEWKMGEPSDVAARVAAMRGAVGADVRRGQPADVFVETPLGPGLRERLEVVRAAQAFAKIRTGGVVPEAIPSADDVAEFIATCAKLLLPFKATAGLHHPLRGSYPLTYEPDAPRAVLHGFLNVWNAASMALLGASVEGVRGALESEPPRDAEPSAKLREFALSFGSCSFTEPVEGLLELGRLPS